MNKSVAAKVIWPAGLRQAGSYLRNEKVRPKWRERNPAWWESAVHYHSLWRDDTQSKDSRTGSQTIVGTDPAFHPCTPSFVLYFLSWVMIRSAKRAAGQHPSGFFKQQQPWSDFAAQCAALWCSSCRQRGQQRAGCKPEQCYYRLSLNQASIRIRCLRERCSGRGERGVNPKHPQAGANRRNAPKAKIVNPEIER